MKNKIKNYWENGAHLFNSQSHLLNLSVLLLTYEKTNFDGESGVHPFNSQSHTVIYCSDIFFFQGLCAQHSTNLLFINYYIL